MRTSAPASKSRLARSTNVSLAPREDETAEIASHAWIVGSAVILA